MSDSILSVTPPAADQRLRYGAAPQHFIDVRLPAKHLGAVMNIHGGFWRNQYDLLHAGHLCAALTKAGWATFNVEYRRVGDEGGGWPGTFEDMRNAYAFLRQDSAKFGIKAEKILVTGHSAGGQLALALAAHEPSLRGAVSLAGVLDLDRAYALHLSHDAVVEFLGGTPQQVPEHYREASPMNLSVSARQVVIAGSADDIVPPQMSRDYSAKKKAAGENVQLVEISKADHFDLIDPRSAAFTRVAEAMQDLSDAQ